MTPTAVINYISRKRIVSIAYVVRVRQERATEFPRIKREAERPRLNNRYAKISFNFIRSLSIREKDRYFRESKENRR